MTFEQLKENYKNNIKSFCDVCKSEILIVGNQKKGVILSAECKQNPKHYAVSATLSDASEKLEDTFKNLPKRNLDKPINQPKLKVA
jgi:hypothetical protein